MNAVDRAKLRASAEKAIQEHQGWHEVSAQNVLALLDQVGAYEKVLCEIRDWEKEHGGGVWQYKFEAVVKLARAALNAVDAPKGE